MQNFAIFGHNLTIVAVEGTVVNPVTGSSVDVAPGERYDVLVTMDQPPGVYWIETSVRYRLVDVFGRAILIYDNADVDLTDNTTPLMENYPDHPLWNESEHGVKQDTSLFTSDVESHPESAALNASDVTRYILVGTQNCRMNSSHACLA